MAKRQVSWALWLAVAAFAGCDAVEVPGGTTAVEAPRATRRIVAAAPGATALKANRWKGQVRAFPREEAALNAAARLPRLADGLSALFEADGALRSPDAIRQVAAARRLRLDEGRVQVVAHVAFPAEFQRGDVATMGGVAMTVDGAADGQVQGWVRLADLPALSKAPGVLSVTVPVAPRTTVTSEGVAKMNVPTVHNLDIKGQGQKIGILDVGFSGYTSLLGTELPASVTTKSFFGSGAGDITGGGEVHGVAVAEVVYDLAPQAQMYLVNCDSEVTLLSAVDWLIAQGVDVITTSTGAYNWENTDGTGPVAAKANAARDAGIVFTAAAGNSGDSHYRATFAPSSVDVYHKFYSTGGNIMLLADDGTNIYYIPQDTPLIIDLVWDDWGANNGTPTSTVDYDLYLAMFDEVTDPANPGWVLVAGSEETQAGAAFPRETIGVYAPQQAVYGIVVARKTNTTALKPFDLFVTNVFSDLNLIGPDLLVPAQSVVSPCCGAKVQCIGAVDVNDALLEYSSRGPSHPNGSGVTLPKPDFVAPSEVSTVTYPKDASNPAGFGGTSGSTPHAAGVAALFLQLASGDAAVAETQMRAAAVDLGTAGRDDTYGYGRVKAVPCWTALCDDGLACTTDTCHATLGCQHAASGTGCLIGGTCIANGAANPENACQKCDQASPTQWSNVTDGTACAADGNDCTVDQCQAGACVHPTAPNGTSCADDGFACTSDLCQGGTCAHAVTAGCLIAGACRAAGAENPENPCQQCAPANKTQWTHKADTTPCEDGLFCTVGDACQSGTCQSGLPRDCSAFADDCNTAACSEGGGACVRTPKTDLTPCTGDGNNCTLDRCESGVCLHPALPNDCGPRVCGTSPNGCHDCGTCPDGFGCGTDGQCTNLCAGVNCPECQACQGGACVPANEGAACTADANECTQDQCVAGTCSHPAVSNGTLCNDGTACTRSDTCQGGACTGADPVVCTAKDVCHVAGSCDPATGTCSDPAKPDASPCTDDGNACTIDACTAGVCTHGSVATGMACDDGDKCTQTDGCVAGQCVGGNPVACPAPVACHSQGTCDPGTGACSDPLEADGVACADDGNECTSDACLAGACDHKARTDGTACTDDGLACTADACGAGVCTHVRQAGCLIGGQCVAAGVPNPANPCESCQEAAPTQWSKVQDGTACEDGLYCTAGDSCQGGACAGGEARDCSGMDGICAFGVCAEDHDACEAAPKENGTPCGDAYSCGSGLLVKADSCQGGVCTDAGTVNCAPYAGCSAPDTCATTCSTGTDCVAGNRCVSGACGANRAPEAKAGDDAMVDEGTEVQLDGTKSEDLDGDPLAYEWTQVGEPAVALDDASIAQPTFTAPEVDAETVLVFRLVVKDGLASSAYDEVQVTVRDVPKPPEGEDATEVQGEDVAVAEGTDVAMPEGEDTAVPPDGVPTDTLEPDGALTDEGRDGLAEETKPMDVPLAEVPSDLGGTDTGKKNGGGGCSTGGASPTALAPLLLALAAFVARRRRD